MWRPTGQQNTTATAQPPAASWTTARRDTQPPHPASKYNADAAAIEASQVQLYSRAKLCQNSKTTSSLQEVAVYATGLGKATALKRGAVKSATQKLRDKQVQEFESFLLHYTQRDLLTCIPADFEAYFAGPWSDAHGKTGKLPSNSSVDTLVSNISIEISLLGREGRWHQQTRQGKRQIIP